MKELGPQEQYYIKQVTAIMSIEDMQVDDQTYISSPADCGRREDCRTDYS